MSEKILVSVDFITYNHGPYVAKALQCIIDQERNFDLEILVHDDASTDNTTEVCREFAEKYPDIIKPILQTENQFSQRKGINFTYQYPRVKGKYLAFCEGDDYWCDKQKLQKQVDFLESHPDYYLCCSASNYVTADDQFIKVDNPFPESMELKPEDVLWKKKQIIATASLIMRSDWINNEKCTRFMRIAPVGDLALQLCALACGKIYYSSDVTVGHRMMVPGSWSERMQSGSKEDKIKKVNVLQTRARNMFNMFNESTDYKYDEDVQKAICRSEFAELQANGDFKSMIKKKYRYFYNLLPLKSKIAFFVMSFKNK